MHDAAVPQFTDAHGAYPYALPASFSPPWTFTARTGLFQGPHTTGEAIKGGRLVAEVMTRLGFRVIPGPQPSLPHPPSMITAVELGSREAMVAFCKGIQLACPVGSYITPEPGKSDQVLQYVQCHVLTCNLSAHLLHWLQPNPQVL